MVRNLEGNVEDRRGLRAIGEGVSFEGMGQCRPLEDHHGNRFRWPLFASRKEDHAVRPMDLGLNHLGGSLDGEVLKRKKK